MSMLKGKKLLILGGKPIGSCEIVEYAKSQGIYTIVADYLPIEKSAAKRIADESWEISTADIDELKKKIIENGINGIYTGVHEFNIRKMIELCESLEFPCFCTLDQWDNLNNKKRFKQLCAQYDIPITREYKSDDLSRLLLEPIEYPVVVKPVDGSGSRGFSICHSSDDLEKAYCVARKFSESGKVLVEKYMNYENSAIINYTLINGELFFNGISDKHSKKVFSTGAPIMSVQFYPSKYEQKFLNDLNEKVKNMFKGYGLKNGVIWIEAFCDHGQFTFNEMGFRFGGSLTYLPVHYLYGVDQLALQIEYALTGKNERKLTQEQKISPKTYCIFPVHVKAGTIMQVCGIEALQKREGFVKLVPVHYLGDKIEEWGSAQQVFAYIHFVAENREAAEKEIDCIINTLSVFDEHGNQMLFNLYKGV